MDRRQEIEQAKAELRNLGVDVMDWGEADGYSEGTAFVFIWRNDETGEVFADNTGRCVSEMFDGKRYRNPIGYREDVHQILARYELVTEWANAGQIAVYIEKDAPGFSHAAEAARNSAGKG